MKKKVVSKGYTITVVSWENDGDNYNTNSLTVDSLTKAKALHELMMLCRSENNRRDGAIGLGNSMGFNARQNQAIIDVFKNNPVLYENQRIVNDDSYLHLFSDIRYELLGPSEYYACRVMDSCTVTFSDKDIYVERIDF